MGLNKFFNIRRSLPESGNKFYNTTSNGGYSWCIQGSPVCSGRNVLANCVGWACSRFNEVQGKMKYPALNCNAENFIERAQEYYGLKVVPYPTVGGIMVWQKGATLSGNDGAGHVAFVEDIDENTGVPYTSESGYGSSAFWNSYRSNANGRYGLSSGYTFRGCIVNPAIGDVHYEAPKAVDPFPGVSDEELAKRVWNGEFGNGDDRKAKLGIRYNTVQALVDKGVGKPEAPKPAEPTPVVDDNAQLLELVKRTIRGDFGNGNARKKALGTDYDRVMYHVNKNIKAKLTRWDNIKLF